LATITFRKNGKPVPITGTVTCATCGKEFPADQILTVEHRDKDTRLAIHHPPGHKTSFITEGPDAITLFVIDAR
jgi:hypothetical protein